MLPFLKPKKQSTTVIMGKSEEHAEDEQPHALMATAERLISAIHAKDANAVAEALSELNKDEQE